MSLSQETMLDLMAYADGELEEPSRSRVEALIASDPEADAFVASIQTLGACVRVAGETRDLRRADGVADDVMNAIATMHAETGEPKVVRLRRAFAAGGVTALAIAAAWFVFLRAPGVHTTVAAQRAAASGAIVEPAPGGVEVDGVESQDPVSVFYVPASNESVSSVVIWIGEDHDENGH